MPQELVSAAAMSGMQQTRRGSDASQDEDASGDWQDGQTPHVDSPSISAGWTEAEATPAAKADPYWSSLARQDEVSDDTRPAKSSKLKSLGQSYGGSIAPFLKSANWAQALPGAVTLPTICLALGAMVFALLAWRADVVRAMPQTAAFFKMIGMGVNLRGLAFEDLKISTEIVNNKPVLLIEGALIDVARKSVEIPRLRFIVRDAKGADIYAWNAVLEQPVLNPGDKAWFKTRLASPPAEGREIAVRFFHKLDIASGGT
jgi:hypothetical protein